MQRLGRMRGPSFSFSGAARPTPPHPHPPPSPHCPQRHNLRPQHTVFPAYRERDIDKVRPCLLGTPLPAAPAPVLPALLCPLRRCQHAPPGSWGSPCDAAHYRRVGSHRCVLRGRIVQCVAPQCGPRSTQPVAQKGTHLGSWAWQHPACSQDSPLFLPLLRRCRCCTTGWRRCPAGCLTPECSPFVRARWAGHA